GVTIRNGADGGIFNEGTLLVENSTITDNTPRLFEGTGMGGGIRNLPGSTLTLKNSIVVANRGIAIAGFGGISNDGTLLVENSTIADNPAGLDGSSGGYATFPADGGGIYNNGMLTVKNSTIVGNSAVGGFGGGIFNNFCPCPVTIENSTIAGNSAG